MIIKKRIAELKMRKRQGVMGWRVYILSPHHRIRVQIFKQYLNTLIRNKVIEQLGKKALLKGKRIVIRVDDRSVYLMGELESWEQAMEVRGVIEGLQLGRKVVNRLTIRPKMNGYRFQKNLL